MKENGSLVKRLRRRPLTAETGVRFPYELLTVISKEINSPTRKLSVCQMVYWQFFMLYDFIVCQKKM